jgi:hypothetical protein
MASEIVEQPMDPDLAEQEAFARGYQAAIAALDPENANTVKIAAEAIDALCATPQAQAPLTQQGQPYGGTPNYGFAYGGYDVVQNYGSDQNGLRSPLRQPTSEQIARAVISALRSAVEG